MNCVFKKSSPIFVVALILSLTMAPGAQARGKKIPLLPPKLASIDETTGESRAAAYDPTFNRFSFGAELGGIGAQSLQAPTPSKSFFGGRIVGQFGLTPTLSLKISGGFYGQAGSTLFVLQMERILEAGVIVQYSVFQNQTWGSWVGIANRIDYVLESNTATPTPATYDSDFRYRVGPNVGFSYRLQPELDATAQVEGTYLFTTPAIYGNITVGLIYHLF